jgi:hypothetical protein
MPVLSSAVFRRYLNPVLPLVLMDAESSQPMNS